jgi:hypothetical protein
MLRVVRGGPAVGAGRPRSVVNSRSPVSGVTTDWPDLLFKPLSPPHLTVVRARAHGPFSSTPPTGVIVE